MKIAHVFCYAGGGGAEAHALDLAKSVIKNGDEAVFIVSTEGQLTQSLKKENIRYFHLKMESSFNPFFVLKSALRLKKIIKQEKIDIVHTHMLREQSLTILAKIFRANVKLIRTFHRLDQFNLKMKPLMGLYNSKTDKFIAISGYMKSYLEKNGIKEKIEVIPNGVAEISVARHQANLGNLGRLSKEKGLLRFLEENEDLFKANKFILGGDGPEEKKIKYLVEKKGLNVELLGRVVDRANFFEKISVFVLPSESEALPLVVLEAFSCGIPVVCFDIPALREVVQEELRVAAGDYKKLAKVALFAMENKGRFGSENRKKYLEMYRLEKMLEKTQELYRNLV